MLSRNRQYVSRLPYSMAVPSPTPLLVSRQKPMRRNSNPTQTTFGYRAKVTPSKTMQNQSPPPGKPAFHLLHLRVMMEDSSRPAALTATPPRLLRLVSGASARATDDPSAATAATAAAAAAATPPKEARWACGSPRRRRNRTNSEG